MKTRKIKDVIHHLFFRVGLAETVSRPSLARWRKAPENVSDGDCLRPHASMARFSSKGMRTPDIGSRPPWYGLPLFFFGLSVIDRLMKIGHRPGRKPGWAPALFLIEESFEPLIVPWLQRRPHTASLASRQFIILDEIRRG
jgi:hypothetical protein